MTNELSLHTRRLIDTGPICYPGPAGITFRPCRTWAIQRPDGASLIVSVVTEVGEGRSVTNAAEDVVNGLWQTWGDKGAALLVVEHYRADAFDPERFALYEHDDGRFTGFAHLPVSELHELIDEAELLRTDPGAGWSMDTVPEIL